MGCIFCGRKPEKRLADDGKYYTGAEFVRHYGAVEAEWRWKAAPSDWELRIGSDGRSHDAKWVYWDNKNKGGPDWNHYKNGFKPGWTTAPKVGKHFRAEK